MISEHRLIRTEWVTRLRWAVAALHVPILAAALLGRIEVAATPVAGVLGIGVLSNLGLVALARRGGLASRARLGAVFVLDTLLLTGLLAAWGGASNPFTFLYLVPVVLTASLAGTAWTWTVLALAGGCYGLLFTLPMDPHAMHGDGMRAHLLGMWAGMVLSGAIVAIAITRIQAAFADADDRLAEARDLRQRSERLGSLATLAAGAAHESATPLNTIAVVAGDLAASHEAEVRQDAALLREEVLRCREILARPLGDALVIEVRDQGTGMAPEVLARAVEPFYTTKAPGEGMGLGLYFARSVAEHLGGELRIASTPGRGTVASLVLPVRIQAAVA